MLPKALERLIEEFNTLPGIGPRTAERLAFFALKNGRAGSQSLAAALEAVHDVESCQICHNLAESTTCRICNNDSRDRQFLAVVEEPLDVAAIEKTGAFKGMYHVLGGVISPIDGVGPQQLNIRSLIKRVQGGDFTEIILATNPSTEGEATALYIQKLLPQNIKVTRLARGLPMGSDLEYADQLTLGRALEGRQAL